MSGEFPLPDPTWEPTRAFWQAAKRKELALPRCATCSAWNWYPPERCRRCGGKNLLWTPLSGRGTLYSWAVVHHAFVKDFASQIPYVSGLVAIDEDPSVRLVTNLVDCAPEDLRVDMPVRVVFRALRFPNSSREVIAPLFAPAV